ncbi:MAG: hypothetical protein KAR83_10055 [Thermodesulfovibrionales bacterium]|nr:hypothetical protein [Thermodesulfovibrionales bacterium]
MWLYNESSQRFFRDKVYRALYELDNALYDHRKRRDDQQFIESIARVMNTLTTLNGKGRPDHIVEFAWKMEKSYFWILNRKLPVSEKIVQVTHEARNWIFDMLEPSLRNDQFFFNIKNLKSESIADSLEKHIASRLEHSQMEREFVLQQGSPLMMLSI